MVQAAEVKIWNTVAGYLSWNEKALCGRFQFDNEFIKTGLDIAPVEMPLSKIDAAKTYTFPPNNEEDWKTFKGLPRFIADSLPDSFGDKVIDAWLKRQGRSPRTFTPLERLCYMGKRGLGALSFFPATTQMNKIVDIDIVELINLAQVVFSQREDLNTNFAYKEKAIKDIVRVGASAGGARPKAIIAYNETTGEIKSGQIAEIPEGFEHYLLKLDGVTKSEALGLSTGMGRVEYAYYKMATDCGIIMSKCLLLEEGGRAHFMTRRFDRPGGGEKLHMQTLCAMAGMNYKLIDTHEYSDLFATMRQLQLPHTDIAQQYRRMVFNIVARNCDDHTKNVSFLMDKTGKWSLSPAYDVSYAYDPASYWNRRHLMGIHGKFENFTLQDLEKTGKEQDIKGCTHIIAQVCDVVSRWAEYAKAAGIDKTLYEPIGQTHEIISLKRKVV